MGDSEFPVAPIPRRSVRSDPPVDEGMEQAKARALAKEAAEKPWLPTTYRLPVVPPWTRTALYAICFTALAAWSGAVVRGPALVIMLIIAVIGVLLAISRSP